MLTFTPPLLFRPPLRMKSVDDDDGLAGQLSTADAALQLILRLALPVRLKGPSVTMSPPRKVRLLLVLSPPEPQSMYQLPLGTTRAPGLHEYTDVQRVNPVGTPVPPSAATSVSIADGPAPGHPFDGL